MEVATSQCEDLASHGYVVVAVDHTYVSAATVFPDRTVTAREATTDFDTPEPAEPITQIMADDAGFVIKKLGEMNDGRIRSPFKGRLALDRIGIAGHSVGGAVAYHLAARDPRVKAAVNLDGTVYIAPDDPSTVAPFLMLANDKYHAGAIARRESLMGQQNMLGVYANQKAYETVFNKAQRNITKLAAVLQASGGLYTIQGSDHMKFTDIGLFIGDKRLREIIQIAGRTDPTRCLEITRSVTAAFFDRHLKGHTADKLTPLLAKFPELRQVDLD
jgi:dienelactone hydrolase